MERTRRFAASPVRPANGAWTEIKTLLAATLERSPQVSDGSVGPALSPLDGLAPALIASGYLATEPLVMVAGDLRLNLYAVRGDDAFDVDEDLDPVPGGASSPDNWRIYVPSSAHLRDSVAQACADHDHLVCNKGPTIAREATQKADTKGLRHRPQRLAAGVSRHDQHLR